MDFSRGLKAALGVISGNPLFDLQRAQICYLLDRIKFVETDEFSYDDELRAKKKLEAQKMQIEVQRSALESATLRLRAYLLEQHIRVLDVGECDTEIVSLVKSLLFRHNQALGLDNVCEADPYTSAHTQLDSQPQPPPINQWSLRYFEPDAQLECCLPEFGGVGAALPPETEVGVLVEQPVEPRVKAHTHTQEVHMRKKFERELKRVEEDYDTTLENLDKSIMERKKLAKEVKELKLFMEEHMDACPLLLSERQLSPREASWMDPVARG
eukprot:GHVR01062841.1.p1 GENE.GHVR01062841.1~~GHVR01062841.1.p1  ORF type:complete len:269 (+),score=72.78 GHVR01062841.1:569-1375(+)